MVPIVKSAKIEIVKKLSVRALGFSGMFPQKKQMTPFLLMKNQINAFT
ncbi:hypothetical protein N568_0109685 [Lactococcus garvieae TRF1]|jgi:hypothetical protein|uniref:Uncharacterized protein n=2 Tax=Lactococcus garvieae TaxID=1363 RepID=F9VBR1_LACGL|nr:hypothetical protein N568_0109685 [Lactococcus garvieae TRF1]BAK57815.1 hypothetical protein LCGT_0302 [Lactococcus garvieae ATCC 49156]BAK59762.1 hypothetical protein LCGL_0302 [Lactococcus garvieae Lg2]